jgi:hypothetical protein
MDSKLKFFKILTLLILGLLASCEQEEFLKVCYNETQTGCVTLDQSRTTPNKIVNFSLENHTMLESEGAFSVAVQLSEPTLVDIIVPFKVKGNLDCTGSKDCRIEGLSVIYDDIKREGKILIPKGKLSKTIIISLIGDTILEDTESLTIELMTPENAEVGSRSKFKLNVQDDDIKAVAQFNTTSFTYSESAGTISALIDLSKPSEKPISIDVELTGDAEKDIDYTLDSIQLVSPTQMQVNITIIDETVYENTEQIIMDLKDPQNLTIGTNTTATIDITNNDSMPYIYYSNAFASADEDDDEYMLEISLSSPANMDITIDLSNSGTANMGDDYNFDTGEVTIPAMETKVLIPIIIEDDDVSELDETAIVTMSNPVNCILSPSNVFTLTIKDNESPPMVGFQFKTQSVYESKGLAIILVKLDRPSGSDLTIPYTVSGSAVNPTHHDLADGNLVIPAGQTEAGLTVNISDDGNHGINRTIIVDLGIAPGTTQSPIQQHTLEIFDPKFITLPIDLATFTTLPSTGVSSIDINDDLTDVFLGTSYGLASSNNTGITFNSYGTKLGIRDLKINDVAIDKISGMSSYAATDTGLLISNNYRDGFEHYDSSNGIASDKLVKVAANDGKIAVIADVGGGIFNLSVSRDNGDTWYNYTTLDGIPGNVINNITYIKETDSLVIMTDQGVVTTQTWIPPYSAVVDDTILEGKDVIDYIYNEDNEYHYILTKTGLNIGDPSNPASIIKFSKGVDFSNDGNLQKVLVIDNGILLVKDTNIEYSNDGASGPFVKRDSFNYVSGAITYIEPFTNITDAGYDNIGNLYLTSSTNGIYKTSTVFSDVNSNSLIKATKSLKSPIINDVDVDGSDLIIAATNYGLAYSATTTYDDFFVNTNIGDNKIEDIHIDGTNYVILTDQGIYQSTVLPTFTDSSLNSLFDNIPFLYDGGTMVYKAGANLLANTTAGGLLLSTDTGATTTEELGGGNILDDQVNSVTYNAGSTEYAVATDMGVTIFSGLNFAADKITDIDQFFSGDLATNKTRKYLELDNGVSLAAKYIATDAGLYYSFDAYDGDNFTHYCAPKAGNFDWCYSTFGLQSGNILAMDVVEVSGTHVLVVGTDKEVAVSFNTGYSFSSYRLMHGIPNEKINAVKIMSDGRVVIGTDYGLAISRDDFL